MTYLLLVAALAFPSPLAGAPHAGAPEPPPLTLDRAVAIALDRQPSIRAADFGIIAARETTGEARSAFVPAVDLTAGYLRWERHAFLPDGIGSPGLKPTIGPTNDWFAGLTGRVVLFDSGERAAQVRAALAGEHLAEAEAAQLRQDLALQVHEAFYGLGAALQGRDVATQEAARAEDHLRLAEARKAAGAVPGGDVLRARVSVSEARLHVVSAEHLVRVAAGRLNTAMGLPPDTVVSPVVGEGPSAPPTVTLDFASAVSRALIERPALAASRSRLEASREAVERAESQFGPRVSADWHVGTRDAEWWPKDRDWSAGFTVRLPLFDGGARARALGRARAELSRAESTLEADRFVVRQEVWDARSQLDKSFEAIRATDTIVTEAEESLRVSRERYRVGAGTLTELLDAEATFVRAAATRVQALLEYRTARAAFDRSIGELKVTPLPRPAS